jgi:hypothetical protein
MTQGKTAEGAAAWIPAFAGMTGKLGYSTEPNPKTPTQEP